jgi:hypothetical protein
MSQFLAGRLRIWDLFSAVQLSYVQFVVLVHCSWGILDLRLCPQGWGPDPPVGPRWASIAVDQGRTWICFRTGRPRMGTSSAIPKDSRCKHSTHILSSPLMHANALAAFFWFEG